MQRSDSRILTTHAGSLPRPKSLVELQRRISSGERVDAVALDAEIETATRRAVQRQLECGIDIGNDGEQPREGFFTYVRYRMSGFGGEGQRPPVRDLMTYPSFQELYQRMARPSLHSAPPRAVGEVRYLSRAPLDRELAAYQRILGEQSGHFLETFWTAPSPGIIACAMQDTYYGSLAKYVDAVADALRVEYAAILAAGFTLQIDGPDLAMERHRLFADRPLAEFLSFVDLTISAINRALADAPRDRVRLHVCWGNYEGPHNFDVPVEDLLPHLYRANVGGLVLSMANPRHEHEYRSLARYPLPDDWLIVAGAIDTTTNFVEHPEVVADRIVRVAEALGDPRRVLAGTDCGFDTSTGAGWVAEEVVWEKLRALRQGAELATKRLF
jgi:5-methyltetrahydropteroyltriglutamate--homocysteine methyltransferase